MKAKSEPSSVIDKERIRDKINEQIDAFLRSGGQIDVLTNESKSTRISSVGNIWSDTDDLSNVVD